MGGYTAHAVKPNKELSDHIDSDTKNTAGLEQEYTLAPAFFFFLEDISVSLTESVDEMRGGEV